MKTSYIYNLINSTDFIKEIYKPNNIEHCENKRIIQKKYDISQFKDIPEELKKLINFNPNITLKTIQNNEYIDDDNFRFIYTTNLNIPDIDLFDNFSYVVMINYKNNELKFDIYHNKDYIEIENNPIKKIILMIFASYIDEIVGTKIKHKFNKRIHKIIHHTDLNII